MTKPSAAHPLTATLAWSPDQNGGAVSMLRGRVPLATIIGALAAGETVATVADEFGCTVDDARVAAQLVEDVRDGLFDQTRPDPADVSALVALTLSELAGDLPVDLVPRVVARKAVEVTLRAVGTDDTDLTNVAVRARADGRLAAFADATDLTPVLANRTGLADPAGELVGIARDLPDGRVRDLLLAVATGITGTLDDEENGT